MISLNLPLPLAPTRKQECYRFLSSSPRTILTKAKGDGKRKQISDEAKSFLPPCLPRFLCHHDKSIALRIQAFNWPCWRWPPGVCHTILKSSMENGAKNSSPSFSLRTSMRNVILVHIMGCQLSNLIGVLGFLIGLSCVCVTSLLLGCSHSNDTTKEGWGQISGSKTRVTQKLSIPKLGDGDKIGRAHV